MNPHDLIVRPLLTEKSTSLRENYNKVCFVVRREANRREVKQAIEAILNVKVDKVHIINMIGKTKRLNRFVGKRRDWKKAIVTLKKGEKLDLFEG
ncbi:MAG: 50S ribosomal protein L23 [Nitrospira sp.]|nr:50S ribosomal protein L23 [Candidatus Manganitrophaceae bacterium]HIL35526.1 50S ribosomal protein L23 [Candidatus Manganitrophaceae bacterium]